MKKLVSGLSVAVLVVGLVVLGSWWAGRHIFRTETETSTTQIINSVTREQQVVLLALGIQGITTEDSDKKFLGVTIPGSGEKTLLQYNFDAKLGIDGQGVTIKETAPEKFLVRIPKFIFIGHDNEKFQTVDTDGGVLSFITPDIDEAEMISTILNDKAQVQYITNNLGILQDQAEVFYKGLIQGIDAGASVSFEFADSTSTP